MKRLIYSQNRSKLNQETYREGFFAGYQAGANAAIECLQVEDFTYADHYNDEHNLFFFEQEDWGRFKRPRRSRL